MTFAAVNYHHNKNRTIKSISLRFICGTSLCKNLLTCDLLPYYLTLLSAVTLINTSSYAVKLWPSACVRWGCLSDGCSGDAGLDGGLCNGGSRGVVVNGAEAYFLICVTKGVHTYKDALNGWSQSLFSWMINMTTKRSAMTTMTVKAPFYCYFAIMTFPLTHHSPALVPIIPVV